MKAKHGVICPLAVLAVLLVVVVAMAQWDTARAAGSFTVNNTFEVHNAERGAQCDNAVDDDNDGFINDGCPNAGPVAPIVGKAEVACDDAVDDDGDTKVNDGCNAKGPTAAGDHADVQGLFSIPKGDYLYNKMTITLSPVEFTANTEIPIGAWAGNLTSNSTLGLMNGPCTTGLFVEFNMFYATLDKSSTVSFTDSTADLDGNGLADGVEKYPDYLDALFPGLTPTMRLFGMASVAGTAVTMNIVYFPPGTSLLGQTFEASLGVPSVSVLNNPMAMLAPGSITDNCTPVDALTTTYGYTRDNPNTAADESGKPFSTNPTKAGDYTFTMWAYNRADSDGDGYENYIDTCPLVANEGDPRVTGSGDNDKDAIDNACDPTPDENTGQGDHDGDMYANRGDLCVLVPNGPKQKDVPGVGNQTDTDSDDLGDACDPNPTTRDGELIVRTVPGTVTLAAAAAGATPTTAPAATPTTAPAATATTAPKATPTTPPAATPTTPPAVTPKVTPTVAVTPKATTPAATTPSINAGGAGLLRSDDGFPMWAMCIIGAAAALMLGSIGMVATVVWHRRQ